MKNWITYFIPEKYLSDTELNRKSRFIIWFTYFLSVLTIGISTYTYTVRPFDIIVVLMACITPLFSFGALLFFKRNGSFIIITHLFCGFFILAMVGSPLESGGIFSPDMPTVYITPILAMIMGNIRIGLFYATLMMAVFFGYYFVSPEDEVLFRKQTEILPKGYYLMNIVMNAIVILVLLFRNENLRQLLLGEIKQTNAVILHKNKEITDSINYARRIQTAILPQQNTIDQNLPNSFFLYKPKDIVSGDFYWIGQKKGYTFLVVADCTGHGVPGAFMSVVGVNQLENIINERGIVEPELILGELNKGVVEVLHQDQTETNDGMDIALIRFKQGESTINYAGANRPLYMVRANQLTEVKPTKSPIGGFNSGSTKLFSTNEVVLQSNDMVFFSTDGYADQFGSDKNKKITTKNFKRMLESISEKGLNEQKAYLDNFFNKWKENYEQTDDVLVVGLRF